MGAFADLPFVVGFGQDGAGQAEQGSEAGEHADDVGAALDFLVQPFEGLVLQIFSSG